MSDLQFWFESVINVIMVPIKIDVLSVIVRELQMPIIVKSVLNFKKIGMDVLK